MVLGARIALAGFFGWRAADRSAAHALIPGSLRLPGDALKTHERPHKFPDDSISRPGCAHCNRGFVLHEQKNLSGNDAIGRESRVPLTKVNDAFPHATGKRSHS